MMNNIKVFKPFNKNIKIY